MLMRVDGHRAPDSTVLRALRRSGRAQPIDYQAERRQLAEARRAAFVVPPLGPNQVWQLDFERHEALSNRAVVKGHCLRSVAAGR
jgi:hypothetical protein